MLQIGKHSYYGAHTDTYDADIIVGNFTSIANGAVFLGTCEHPPKENRKVVTTFNFKERWGLDFYPCTGKPIVIGNDVWIGENVIILDGVTIGNGAIIGAGTVVASNVPDYTIFCGNPGEVKRLRYESHQVMALLEIKWWEWDDQKIKDCIEDFKDINMFIQKHGKKS